MNDTTPPLDPGAFALDGPPLFTTTVADLGNTLPSGLQVEGGRLRDFELLPQTMGLQKRVGALRVRKDLAKAPAKLAAYMVGVSLRSLCGQDMTTKSDDERALAVGRLPIGDVFFLFYGIYRARHRRGYALEGFRCSGCGASFESLRVDVGDVECTAVGEAAPTARVQLFEGFPHAEGTATLLELATPSYAEVFWDMSEDMMQNTALVQSEMVRHAIRSTNVRSGPVPSSSTDELIYEDLEVIGEALEAISVSTDQDVEVTCPSCRQDQIVEVPWQSLGFF